MKNEAAAGSWKKSPSAFDIKQQRKKTLTKKKKMEMPFAIFEQNNIS